MWPLNIGRAQAQITIKHNPNGPAWTLGNFETLIQDSHIVGTEVINITASDADGVSMQVPSTLTAMVRAMLISDWFVEFVVYSSDA